MKKNVYFYMFCLCSLCASLVLSADITEKNNALINYVEPDLLRHYLSVSPSLRAHGLLNSQETPDYHSNRYYRNHFRTNLSFWHYLKISDRSKLITSDNVLQFRSYDPFSNITHQYFRTSGDNAHFSQDKNTRYKYIFKTSGSYVKYLSEKLHFGGTVFLRLSHHPRDRQYDITKSINKGGAEALDTITAENEFSISERETKERRFNLNPAIKLNFGMGRVEEVTEAAAVLNIIDRINELGKTNYSLNSTKMRNMGKFIEDRRRKRDFADPRQASIYDGESMVMFLEQENISVAQNPRLILEISDLWDIRRSQQRYSGWTLDFYPRMNVFNKTSKRMVDSKSGLFYTVLDTPYSQSQIEKMNEFGDSATIELQTTDEKSKQMDLAVEGELVYHKPIKRFFQLQTDISALYQLSIHESKILRPDSENKYGYRQTIFSFQCENKIFWYPSTRTTLSFSTIFRYFYNFKPNGIYYQTITNYTRIPDGYTNFDAFLLINLKYFLTPRLGYHVDFSLRYLNRNLNDISVSALEHRPINTAKDFSTSLSFSLKYFLF